MPSAPLTHDQNVIAAAAVVLGDRIRAAVEEAAGNTGASATALTALLGWADGTHIDALAAGLRLSHSRAVRVVDRLESQALVVRRTDPTDARRAQVHLTSQGRALARRALRARNNVVEEMLSGLSVASLLPLARGAADLIGAEVTSRAEARAICRMCDVTACGHAEGTCPSTTAAEHLDTLSGA